MWLNELKANMENIDDILIVLVGNKINMENCRKVTKNEAQAFVREIGALYWETSAKTGFNVNEMFAVICLKIKSDFCITTEISHNNFLRKGRSIDIIPNQTGFHL